MPLEKLMEAACKPYIGTDIEATIITDKDGIVVSKWTSTSNLDAILERFPSTFAVYSNQASASKLGLGRNRHILSAYEAHQILQIDVAPLIVTVVGTGEANTGILLETGAKIEKIAQAIVQALPQQDTRTQPNPT
ncbi:hypothetical protein BZG36_02916 [Bifiguratus adelaidae]|uniref:Roadblock/LAMTOR2 domain-containing protein n=1 Tax=Bifiguratus adelaidae TaxID=1938954 RepID=A0A261Y1M9_9FUNG|nr:hypothetical protein BZG36_02916 [Bifiguratus adelaidae]